jgi:hypothetical protein
MMRLLKQLDSVLEDPHELVVNQEPLAIVLDRHPQIAVRMPLHSRCLVGKHLDKIDEIHAGNAIFKVFRMVRVDGIVMAKSHAEAFERFFVFSAPIRQDAKLWRKFVEDFFLWWP